jgi:hypothetical protein
MYEVLTLLLCDVDHMLLGVNFVVVEHVIIGIYMHVCVYIWAPRYYALLMTINLFFLCFHMIFNNSSLFISVSNLI